MYMVVLEGTGGPESNYKGIRTIIDFGTKEEFERSRREFPIADIVIAEGLTDEEARRLGDAGPIEAYFHAAVTEAFESGVYDPNIFRMKIANAEMLMRYRLNKQA